MNAGGRATVLLAIACFAAELRAQEPLPPVGGLKVVGQVAAGTVAIPVGFLAGGLLSRRVARGLGASETTASALGRVGGGAGAALFAAAGVTGVGSRGPVTGSYLNSLGGAVAGGLASYALVRLNRRPADADASWRCGMVCRASVVAIVLLPATGATLAYNASRRRE